MPESFPNVGVSELVRKLAYRMDQRLTAAGQERGMRLNWRHEPVTKYRQRSMAFAEASRLRGTMREEMTKRITEAEGIDQACSGCDERCHASATSVPNYAAQYVVRMYATRNVDAYQDSEEERMESSEDETVESECSYEPSIAPNEDEPPPRVFFTDCPGGHGLRIHRTKESGWSCSECEQTFPAQTYLMRCEKCDYNLCSDCFGSQKDSIMKFETELQDDSDKGAEADDEDTDGL